MKNLNFMGYPRYAATRDGRVWSEFSNKFLSDNKRLGDYPAVTLCNESTRKEKTIHRLVAKAFIPNPEGLPCVNHIDGDKTNNHVSNLEWCSYRDNTLHAMATGLHRTTVINDYRSLSVELAHKICDMLERGSRNKDICEALGVTPATVSAIKGGKEYKDISCEYNFRKIPSANRISEEKVFGICEALQDGKLSVSKIRLMYKVAPKTVKSIKERKTYTYISDSYEW